MIQRYRLKFLFSRLMLHKLAKTIRRREESPARIVLREDGFDLYQAEVINSGVLWSEVDKISAFKRDLVTYDLVCIEFVIGAKDSLIEVNDDVEGFWEMVGRLKEIFPDSQQDWELSVIKPAFELCETVIYEKGVAGIDS